MRGDGTRSRNHAELFASEYLVATAAHGLATRRHQRERDVPYRGCTWNLPRALQLKGGASVVGDGGVSGSREPAEHRVGLVAGAADRVVTVPGRAQLVGGEIEVPRAQHRLEQLPKRFGIGGKLATSLEAGCADLGPKAGDDLLKAIQRHRSPRSSNDYSPSMVCCSSLLPAKLAHSRTRCAHRVIRT